MELTKTKLHKILKKYKVKLEQHDQEWKDLCNKLSKSRGGNTFTYDLPDIYEHERHNSKGAKLFKELMSEFEDYKVFPKSK